MKEEFGNMLRRLRKEKQLTLKRLGEISGISFVEIHNLETGKTKPTAITIHKLCKALKCNFDELFDTLN